MNISVQSKLFVANLLEYSGAARYFISKYSSRKYLILMYHRVLPKKESILGVQAGMYVESHTFDVHIEYLKDSFHVISFSEIMDKDGKYSSLKSKPICILTFDDGWFDFYKYAYPILKAHSVPATVFLPTKYIGTNNQFWTDALTRLCYRREQEKEVCRKRSSSSIPVIDLLESGSGTLETRLERSIDSMKSLPQEEINRILVDLSTRWGIEPTFHGTDFLTWDEVREMHRSGLVSFGSHTETHRILTTLRDDEIDRELRQSKNRLLAEGVVDPMCIPFAYPNGNYNDKIKAMVKNHGYGLAVTTKRGWVQYPDKAEMFELDRIGIHQDMASTGAMFGSRILQVI